MSSSSIVPTTVMPSRRCAIPPHAAGAVMVVLVLLGACAEPPPATTATAAAADRALAAPAATPTLPSAVLPDGTGVTLELAVTPEEIANGLMFRPSLRPDRGMLFLFSEQRTPSFWMKNTLIPLDIVFLGGDGTVVDITRDAQPCAADPCPQYVPQGAVWAVLELSAGRADQHHITEGARLEFHHVPGYPRENEPGR